MDELQDFSWGHSPGTVRFTSAQPISEIHVTVWEKESTSGRAIILFENSQICILTIGINTSIIGTKIDAGRINLLDKLDRKHEKDKPRELAIYDRSSSSGTYEVGGYGETPWVQVGRSSLDLMKQLFPEKSEGNFFMNGWDDSRGASGQLSFVEWILKTISGENEGGLLLIDPYFDKDGIEIFANARTTNTKFRVLTCTQHREKAVNEASVSKEADSTIATAEKLPAGVSSDGQTSAAKALLAACQRALPLLKGLQFSIYDLRSVKGGKTQIFHDRYLLLSNKEGLVTKGFHLSNSIQGATRKAPLLTTPIPPDVLPQVVSYVEGLLEPSESKQSSKKTEVVTIYPLAGGESALKKSATASKTKGRLTGIPDAGFLFAKLLGDTSLETQSLKDLESHLEDIGILEKKESFLLFYRVTPAQLDSFARILSSLQSSSFRKAFAALGEFKARSHYYDHASIRSSEDNEPKEYYNAWNEFKNAAVAFPSIGDKLQAYIGNFDQTERLVQYRDRLYTIFNCDSFESGFEASYSQIRHMPGDIFPLDYGLLAACEVFVEKFPVLAVKYLEDLLEEARKGNWNEGDSHMRARLLLITTLASNFLNYGNRVNVPLQAIFLSSSDACIRAASSAALISGLMDHHKNVALEHVFDQLALRLPDDEYRLAIAALLAELQHPVKDAKQQELQKNLLSRLLRNWTGNEGLIYRVTKVLSGRLPSNHSLFITDNFLLPLVAKNNITPLQAFSIWQAAFLEKIVYREEHKDNGSADQPYNFSLITDIELTQSIIRMLAYLPAEEQLQSIKKWIEAINPGWEIINQPFVRHTAYKRFYASAIRIYWVKFLMIKMGRQKITSGAALDLSLKFLKRYKTELKSIDGFVVELNSSVNELGSLV